MNSRWPRVTIAGMYQLLFGLLVIAVIPACAVGYFATRLSNRRVSVKHILIAVALITGLTAAYKLAAFSLFIGGIRG